MPETEDQVDSPRPSLLGRVVSEVRERPFAYVVTLVFVLIGPVVVHFLFPEAPTVLGVVGGLVFGVYAALCAVPDKFF